MVRAQGSRDNKNARFIKPNILLARASFIGMACAEMVASHIGCRNTEHAKKRILMTGLEVAQKAAVIVADFDESILNKISN